MIQEFESSAFQAHDKEDYRKVWDNVLKDHSMIAFLLYVCDKIE